MPVTLEPVGPHHQAGFLSAVRDSRALHRPWVSPPSTPAAYRRLLERVRDERFIAWLVRTGDGDLAGMIEASEIVRGVFCSAYLGFYAFVPFDARGFMRAGLARAVRELFTTHGLHRLEANIQPGNERSIALVRSLGFRREGYSPRYLKIGGRWRDHERWAVTREDWSARGARSRRRKGAP